MELQLNVIEPTQVSDMLEVASWNRPRSVSELQNFITRREEVVDPTDFINELI